MVVERWEIHPFEGIGPLRFGMPRSEVRAALGENYRVFTKGPFAVNTTDAYDALSLHFFYDVADRLECINAFATCPVYYQTIELLHHPFQDVLRGLADLGLSPREDDGFFFDEGGVALFSSDDTVQAVTVYPKGYYDESLGGGK